MATPLPLRAGFDGPGLRRPARETRDASQTRRHLAPAAIVEGGSRTDAARIGSVTLQIVRDGSCVSNDGGPAGLADGKAPGSPSRLNGEQRRALARIAASGPIPAIHGGGKGRCKKKRRRHGNSGPPSGGRLWDGEESWKVVAAGQAAFLGTWYRSNQWA